MISFRKAQDNFGPPNPPVSLIGIVNPINRKFTFRMFRGLFHSMSWISHSLI